MFHGSDCETAVCPKFTTSCSSKHFHYNYSKCLTMQMWTTAGLTTVFKLQLCWRKLMLPATRNSGTGVVTGKQLLSFSSGHCGTDDAFRCGLRQWGMGLAEPGGTVSTRHHLLDITVDALSFVQFRPPSCQNHHVMVPTQTWSFWPEPDEEAPAGLLLGVRRFYWDQLMQLSEEGSESNWPLCLKL